MPGDPLTVLGIDAGGTSTRAVLAHLDGNHVGHGVAGGANPATQSMAHALAAIVDAARLALTGSSPATVAHVVVGVAGWPRFQEPDVARSLERGWAGLGLRCPVQLVGDVEVAFAAGTPEPAGHILVSGTGAVAAEIADRAVVRMVDGLGWLLGDEGSAFWIGRRAARETVAAYDRQRDRGALTELVAAALHPTGRADLAALITAVYERPPVSLANLAPLVSTAAEQADPLALEIISDAATHLADNLGRIREPDARTTIVLAGSCLLDAEPLIDQVRRLLSERWPAAKINPAADTAAGAAWLAAHHYAKRPDGPDH